MGIAYYLMMPFTWLLTFLYQFFNSYGIALILFALVVKVILFPLSLKGKKGMIQMNMLNGKIQKLQKQYAKDQQKYQQEVQKLYEKEGANPMSGCLWSFLPLFILLPLYAIIRQPLKYMMGLTGEQITAVAQALNWGSVAASNGWIKEAAEFANVGYNQLYLASLITPDKVAVAQAAVGETMKEIFSINFSFFGVNLALQPHLKFWLDGVMGFGLFLVPVVSALTSILFSFVTTKTNNLNNQNQNNSTNMMMLLMSPIMSLWIGFAMPAALSIYWIANNVLGLAQEIISGKLLKKDYEKAAEAARLREIEEKEEEKRLRREKAEQRAREAEEARKNKGKKKEKDPEEARMTAEQKAASRVGMRQYARGRAYDPDRFGGVTPYHEDLEKAAPEEEPPAVEETPVAVEIPAAPEETALDTELEEINDQLDAAIEGEPADEPKED
jgi:YidC/Oxa1 family membrane protein insertase